MKFLKEIDLPDGDDIGVMFTETSPPRTFVYHSHRGKRPNKVVTFVEVNNWIVVIK